MDRKRLTRLCTTLATICVAVGVVLWLYGRQTQSQSVLLLVASEGLIGVGLLLLGVVALWGQ
ncbi:hypothetical protein AA103196_1211 [Ameyamaea chiangmaiensis NBRC 103196]|uniref:Uncharacterized protein n=1 Tax=Ameyamaea chiangmaiensis TaxID=442969 RepID=A0A850PAU6_9PROT|nr:hypothetical protein [Ameyamaea chiangmaiensis]MBS4075021.1 hypothetical protein [Ameyamaea chiangmaiensis]NVN40063.1 hypothetical protein [Ameyamaea chiangmaiensis]GBQ65751.1 hypothetical protein AA103196_1211 [Ameyamaea chiangmaiensis NBRC 103196]